MGLWDVRYVKSPAMVFGRVVTLVDFCHVTMVLQFKLNEIQR
ncbi:unnamed protein product [Brassica oleracea var. botrytis]